MKPYYEDDLVTLYHGRYEDAEIPAADAIVTDPPYGETSLEWDTWPTGWPDAMATVAPSLWVYGSMRMHLAHSREFIAAGWQFSQDFIWEKHNGSGLAADRFRRVHEIANLWYRGEWRDLYHVTPTTPDATPRALRRRATKGEHQGSRGASDYVSEDGGPRLMRSVQYVRSTHGHAVHPTQKPVGAVAPLIEYSTPPGGLVIDPFAGSGTTAIAARHLGRRCVAYEAREDYAEAAAHRLAQQAFDFSSLGDGDAA
ncbi:DNA-methyltransferase [Microbacterium sp. No. 7]|uniref:DNA-methyltransferase n=1 Tax=Microbacterium sp. No. 7 TaxID=1714373 RepID=UPI0006ECF738|nr:site-specific DNA-methyltransferase [Microbacterium sp. No. 7]ALJ22080.1 DNA methylase [Microbacterium sp. No. 7]